MSRNIDLQGLVDIHNEMRRQLSEKEAWLDGILVACDDDATSPGEKRRRKPGPEMLNEALAHFGVSQRDRCYDLFLLLLVAAVNCDI